MRDEAKIAYFSMEIALEEGMPTYSGGLGVLAGDTIRSAANLHVPMVAVTLLHRQGYFFQKLDESGWQIEEPVRWVVEDFLEERKQRVTVQIENRPVRLRAWVYRAVGIHDFEVPVIFLDSELEENTQRDRTLTHTLYGGDTYYRLCQELILGIGGVRMLLALGHTRLEHFHMNEGHAGLLTLELINRLMEEQGANSVSPDMINTVRRQCVFTTHTSVPAGHDKYSMDLITRVVGPHPIFQLNEDFCWDGMMNMTHLALYMSHYVNGVAKKHGEVAKTMFHNYNIDSITNGVNASNWTSLPFQRLFDAYIPGWREDNYSLKYALNIPNAEVWGAHQEAKDRLIEYVNRETNNGLDTESFTIGFARRAATYKRADLVFEDLDRLKLIARDVGSLQFVFGGKAHPQDTGGKEMIKRIVGVKTALRSAIPVVYLPNYDIQLAGLITAGVDLWLNTPVPPLEASGTSGMKAALNGVPSLSILDGWWIEGCIEKVTGWAIGDAGRDNKTNDDQKKDAESLYWKLESDILPLYYGNREGFINLMRHVIALNGSFFNTQRMMHQYVLKAYYL